VPDAEQEQDDDEREGGAEQPEQDEDHRSLSLDGRPADVAGGAPPIGAAVVGEAAERLA